MGQIDFNKVWQNFLETVTGHYVDFNGRVGRQQFWFYMLVYIVLAIAVWIVARVTIMGLYSLFGLALLLPNLGMIVRRLHDTGKPWFYILILFVPAVLAVPLMLMGLVGGVFGLLFSAGLIWLLALAAMGIMIFFCAQPGQAGDNQFGPPPPVWTPG